MAGLSQKELERLVNQIALELEGITDEQAENSDIDGDSDADDEFPLESLRSSASTSRGNSVDTTKKRKEFSKADSGTDEEEEKEEERRCRKEQIRNSEDTFRLSESEDEEEEDEREEDLFDWKSHGINPKLFNFSDFL